MVPSLEQIQQYNETDNKAGVCAAQAHICMLSFLTDKELTVIWANDLFYKLTGYSQKVFNSRFPTLACYYGKNREDFSLIKGKRDEALELGRDGFEVTVRFSVNGSENSYVRLSAAFAGEETGGEPVCHAVLTDVTDLVSQRDELAELYEKKKQYFQWMMDEYSGNVYISDMNTYELLYLNNQSCRALGFTRKELLGRKCYEVIQGLDAPCPFCTNKYLSENEFYEWEFENPNLKQTFMIKDRIISWQGRRARLELSYDGLSSEYKLAKKDREMDAITRTVPGGLMRLDARDMKTILWYGDGFLPMIGYTKEEFENELHSQYAYVHPEDINRTNAKMREVREHGKEDGFEARIITRGGEVKILTVTLSYISGEDSWDGIPSFYSISVDITKAREEQERQRQALEDAYHAARVANSAKTNFLSSMSHDIRTPMNAIMGMTTIAKANLESPEKMRACLEKIETSNRHLLNLINEVLDMSRIESGRIDLSLSEVNLSDLVQNVMDICRPLMVGKNQQFQISIGSVQHENVIADGERLQQILVNLLSNANKYTPEGGVIALRINELFSGVTGRGQYELICTDNGIGISSEFIPHVFEPFTRDPNVSKLQGTGLGMAITENIVRMMNGSIDVHSALGKGSKFTVSVPLELSGEEESGAGELAGRPVLVVDDDHITCINATELLKGLGMRSCWVSSGREAVRSVEAAHEQNDDFFAVILDWMMPGMDGMDTVKAIRKTMGKNVPIIVVSAYDYSEIEEDFILAGADAFITKPLFKSKMLHILQTFITEGAEMEADVPAPASQPLSGKRVLLAEDNDINREIAVELLRMRDVSVDTVENGKRAVEAFEASAPGDYDAVLMDIQMPVMNGYEAAEAIRTIKRKDAKTIPILALTANAFAGDVGKARSSGMNDHIAKPIDPEHLYSVLQQWTSCDRNGETLGGETEL